VNKFAAENGYNSAILSFEKGFGTERVTQNSVEKGVLTAPGKEVPECRSGFCPCEKNFRNGVPGHYVTKIPLDILSMTIFERLT
jgi:hypothetical protein